MKRRHEYRQNTATKKRGRWSFVIKYGVIVWGVGSSLLTSVTVPLIPWVEYTFTQLLAITLPTFCVCGILFGLILWRVLVSSGSDTNGEQVIGGTGGQRP